MRSLLATAAAVGALLSLGGLVVAAIELGVVVVDHLVVGALRAVALAYVTSFYATVRSMAYQRAKSS